MKCSGEKSRQSIKHFDTQHFRRHNTLTHNTLGATLLEDLDNIQFTLIFLMHKIHSEFIQRRDVKYFIVPLSDSSERSSISVAQQKKPP